MAFRTAATQSLVSLPAGRDSGASSRSNRGARSKGANVHPVGLVPLDGSMEHAVWDRLVCVCWPHPRRMQTGIDTTTVWPAVSPCDASLSSSCADLSRGLCSPLLSAVPRAISRTDAAQSVLTRASARPTAPHHEAAAETTQRPEPSRTRLLHLLARSIRDRLPAAAALLTVEVRIRHPSSVPAASDQELWSVRNKDGCAVTSAAHVGGARSARAAACLAPQPADIAFAQSSNGTRERDKLEREAGKEPT
jgi:hypothetical protein